MPGASTQFTNERQVRDIVDRQGRELRRAAQEDVLIDADRRLMLRSPNGHYWSVAVDDTGALTVTDMGTTL